MADNRANTSSSKLIDGLHKSDSNSHSSDYIDPKTIKEINVAYNGISKFAKMLGLNLEKYNDVILESAKKQVSTRQELDKKSKELDNQLDAMRKHYFGKNKKIAEDFEKQIEIQKRDLENEFNEGAVKLRKELIKQSFKNVTTNKSVKIFNSKYANASGFKSMNNSYLSDLEQLKSNALDTFGEGFESNKEYKKALLRMNKEYEGKVFDTMISDMKENFKANHKILSGIGKGIKDTFDRNKDALMGILGPINLIIAPLKDFFGGFGKIFKFIGGGIKTLFGKFTKKVPTANDVVKTGAVGVGSLYLANEIKKLFGGGKGNKELDFGSGIFKDFLDGSSLFKKVVGSPTFQSLATVGGIALVIKDAIEGWKKGEEWGVPNWESMVGAMIGGTGSGVSNAIKSAGKYALLGASFGPFGIFAGALLGGVLGFFGGEFWSQGLDDFRKLITGEKSMKDMQKDSLLEEVEKDYKKGKISKSYYDAMQKLSSTLNTEDFVKLGAKGSLQDVAEQLLSGKFDMLDNDQLNALIGGKFGIDTSIPNALNQLKSILQWTNSNISSEYLKDIYKNSGVFAGYLSNFKDIQKLKSEYKYGGKNIVSDLKKLGFDDEVIQYILNSELEDISHSSVHSITKEKRNRTLYNPYAWGKEYERVDDAIIRSDGSIIRTNPQDTLIALKDINNSMDTVRADTVRSLNNSINNLGGNDTLDKRLNVIIEVLSKILDKDVKITMPQQTRYDLDLIMNGGMI